MSCLDRTVYSKKRQKVVREPLLLATASSPYRSPGNKKLLRRSSGHGVPPSSSNTGVDHLTLRARADRGDFFFFFFFPEHAIIKGDPTQVLLFLL